MAATAASTSPCADLGGAAEEVQNSRCGAHLPMCSALTARGTEALASSLLLRAAWSATDTQLGGFDGGVDSSGVCDSQAHKALVALLSSIAEVERLVFMDARADSDGRASAAKRVRFACYDLSASTSIGDCGSSAGSREAEVARARARNADALLLKLEDAVDAGQQLRAVLLSASAGCECSDANDGGVAPAAPGARAVAQRLQAIVCWLRGEACNAMPQWKSAALFLASELRLLVAHEPVTAHRPHSQPRLPYLHLRTQQAPSTVSPARRLDSLHSPSLLAGRSAVQ